jgi:uncharacterized protein (TIGR03435 family)
MTSSALCDLSNNRSQERSEGRFNAALFPATLALFFFACFSGTAFGQTAAVSPTTGPSGPVPQVTMPTSGQQLKFVIADVHVSTTVHNFAQNFGGVLREGLYINRDVTVLSLIEGAYVVSEDTITGGPAWLGSDLFDVIAKVPSGTTLADANLMLRGLLVDRFGLVIHEGTGSAPRYILRVGKGGPKLKSSGGSETSGCQAQQQGAPPSGPNDPATAPNIKVACHNLTAAAIADNLHQMAGGYLDHDVIDTTKLEGPWDFDLEWTARLALEAKGSAGISIFDAVEKQLGLKLELQNVQVPSLVIESVNRKPTANPEGIATQLAVPAARFEVASIKLANPDDPFRGLLYTGGSQMRAGGTLRTLIAMALQISPNVAADMIVDLPKSADSERWDITAKLPSTGEGAPNMVNGRPMPPPLSVGLEMLRGVLLDQFQLKTHSENREIKVYELTVPSGKPKLTPAGDSERAGCRPDPNARKPTTNIQLMISCKNTSMTELAQNLQQWAGAYIDHPVVDATGLQGGWDFLIGWTPKALLQASNPTPTSGAVPEPSDPGGMSVFEAVANELGLKLTVQKRSIPVIVVDHVSEKPIE